MPKKEHNNPTMSRLISILPQILQTLMIASFVSCGRTDKTESYDQLVGNYAEVILTNNSNDKIHFHGESGAEDPYLIAFLTQKERDKFYLFIEQNEQDSIVLYPAILPDTTFLFTYSSQYDTSLVLYDAPYSQSAIDVIRDYLTIPLRVIDVDGLWLKVKFIHESQKYEGWLSPNEYCSNPYTTCN